MFTTVCLGFVLAFDTCATCSLEGQDARLCDAHAAEERKVSVRESARLRAKDEAGRIAALDALAALTQPHENAPSAKVVSLIASALDDDSFAVREHATGLLTKPQNAESVLSALAQALSAAEKQRKLLDDALRKARERLRQEHLPDARRTALAHEETAAAENLGALMHWRTALLERLAAIPDDRAVAAICEHTPRDLGVKGSEVLVRIGSRAAMDAFVAGLKPWELELARLQKAIDEFAKDPKAPENRKNSLGMTALEGERMMLEISGRLTLGEVGVHFAKQQIAPPMTMGIGADAEWSHWLQENLGLFPEHLPGVTAAW